jgi:hypothetical protein
MAEVPLSLKFIVLSETEEGIFADNSYFAQYIQATYTEESLNRTLELCRNRLICDKFTIYTDLGNQEISVDTLSVLLTRLAKDFNSSNARKLRLIENVDFDQEIVTFYVKIQKNLNNKKVRNVSNSGSGIDSQDSGNKRSRNERKYPPHVIKTRASLIKEFLPRDGQGCFSKEWKLNDPYFWGWGLVECIGRIKDLYERNGLDNSAKDVRQFIKKSVLT